MSWSIYEIEYDSLPLHTYRSELDRDTTFAFEVHIVERLRLDLSFLKRPGDLHEAISKG